MANSVDPDQTALFVKACLSENLGSLRYMTKTNLLLIVLAQNSLFVQCTKLFGNWNFVEFSSK